MSDEFRVFFEAWTLIDVGTRIFNKTKMGVCVQDEIRWRLRTVYDREEINDVLRHLLREGYIRKDYHAGERVLECGPADGEEEKRTFWRVGSEKHWYQV